MMMMMMMTYLVYILLSSWTSISELLNSFSSFLMAACKSNQKTECEQRHRQHRITNICSWISTLQQRLAPTSILHVHV